MLGVILTGHGGFATGLAEATVQIMGEQPQFMAIDFTDGMSSDQLEQQLHVALNQCNQGDGVIFLTDILGGSPFRIASTLSFEQPNIEVITGTNMSLLLEMFLKRDELDAELFRNMALIYAKNGITSLWHESNKKQYIGEPVDGI